MAATIQLISLALGFAGLLVLFLAFTLGEDLLKSKFPKMRTPQRKRVVSIVVLFAALVTVSGLVGSMVSRSDSLCSVFDGGEDTGAGWCADGIADPGGGPN